jgi:hypothetical protein
MALECTAQCQPHSHQQLLVACPVSNVRSAGMTHEATSKVRCLTPL